jgi:hypothetical protein
VRRPRRTAAAALALALAIPVLGAPGAPAARAAAGCRVVADFAAGQPGEFPPDWQARDDGARATYRLAVENGLRFVRGTAAGTGSQMGHEFEWDLEANPVLRWRWRPRLFPAGADERDPHRNDSVLAVYVVFGNRVTGTAVKYVWSRAVPAGTALPSGRARVIVLRSGAPSGDGWIDESVDVPRDYARLFGEAPRSNPRGVAVLTDADQTHSRAIGDYGPFQICPPASG